MTVAALRIEGETAIEGRDAETVGQGSAALMLGLFVPGLADLGTVRFKLVE